MSNIKCCVPGCENSAGSSETLHKFPNPEKDKALFNTWIYSIGGNILELDDEHIFKYRRVCHQHFDSKYWCRNNRISNIAVPTINMPGPLSLSKFKLSERRPLTTEPSSSKSKDPVASVHLQPYSEKAMEDIEMKENLDPGITTPHQNPMTVQQHPDFEMKENIVSMSPEITTGKRRPLTLIQTRQPGTSKEHVGSLHLQLQSENPVEDISMKENLDPATVATQLNLVTAQSHCQSIAQDVQMVEKLVTHKMESPKVIVHKLRKRIITTPAEHVLYKKLLQVGVKLSKCRNKNKKQAMKIKVLQNLTTNPQFLKTMDNLSSTAKILTCMQFREAKKETKGRRFTIKEKIVALSIMKQSPKGYKFLRKIFILPAAQTLQKLLNMANIKPGINENIINQIKTATETMKIEERLCIVLFDEMSLKANVTYNERKDVVTGFVTNGYDTQPEFADHAQVFMVRGLIKNYKQPVSYTFSQAATKGPELAKQLKAVITELQAAGLIVVATVCDQGTSNVQCVKILTQETRISLLKDGQELRENQFTVNGQEIIPLYDPPHLITCIRNNLLHHHHHHVSL